MTKRLIFFALLTFIQCTTPDTMDKALWMEEIHQTEKAFNDMAAEQGIPAAFLAFAADEAVLIRGNQTVKGKAAIRSYFEQQTLQDVQLSWSPEFIDVSDDGSMGYTYGPYTFSARDTSGRSVESTGIFHTVWKRQADGGWKFVYD